MFKFVVTKVTESKTYSCKIINSYGAMTGEHTFSIGLTIRNNLLLNILRLDDLRIRRSSLFPSIIVERKKVFTK